MKRIDATIQSNKTGIVTEAIKHIVGGLTITEGKGRGSGKRQTIKLGRGTGPSKVAEYSQVAIVSTIVTDEDVEKVVEAIADASYAGDSGDGIVTVSNIESVLNISSKKGGIEAL